MRTLGLGLLFILLACGESPPTYDRGPIDAAVETCSEGQLRCRGHCFTHLGEKANGCELVLEKSQHDLHSIDVVDGELYAVEFSQDDITLVHIDRKDFSVQAVVPLPAGPGPRDVKVVDGYAYFANFNVTPAAVQRVRVGSDKVERVADKRMDPNAYFHVQDGYLYQFGDDGSLPLQRTPLTGGVTEALGQARRIDQLVIAADNYYVHTVYPDDQMLRVSREDPSKFLNALYRRPLDVPLVNFMMLWPKDPKHVYVWIGGDYLRFDTRILEVETVVKTEVRGVGVKQVGDHFMIRENDGHGLAHIVGLRMDGTLDVIDPSDSDSDVTEDKKYYYVERLGSLFRIVR